MYLSVFIKNNKHKLDYMNKNNFKDVISSELLWVEKNVVQPPNSPNISPLGTVRAISSAATTALLPLTLGGNTYSHPR